MPQQNFFSGLEQSLPVGLQLGQQRQQLQAQKAQQEFQKDMQIMQVGINMMDKNKPTAVRKQGFDVVKTALGKYRKDLGIGGDFDLDNIPFDEDMVKVFNQKGKPIFEAFAETKDLQTFQRDMSALIGEVYEAGSPESKIARKDVESFVKTEQGLRKRVDTYRQKGWTDTPKGQTPDAMVGRTGLTRPKEEPYKIGTIKSFKEGDQFVDKKYSGQGKWEAIGKAPRYKPGTTINIGGKPAPASERENLNKLFEFQGELTRIDENWEPMFTGPLQGRAGAIRDTVGVKIGRTDEKATKEATFRQVTKNISDTLLRLRSGAQINEQEYQRLLKLVPHANLPDHVFRARLKSLSTAIDNSIKIRQGSLKESGFKAPTGGGGETINLNLSPEASSFLREQGL